MKERSMRKMALKKSERNFERGSNSTFHKVVHFDELERGQIQAESISLSSSSSRSYPQRFGTPTMIQIERLTTMKQKKQIEFLQQAKAEVVPEKPKVRKIKSVEVLKGKGILA